MKTPKRFEHAKWDDVPLGIKDLVNKFKASRRGIFITGKAGTGKTHLAYAIANYCAEEIAPVLFWNIPELLKNIRDDYGQRLENKSGEFRKLMESRDLLVLDDLGAEKMTEWVEETFYIIINNRYEEMLPTIITSNLTLDELSTRLNDRIVSRIAGMCDVFELKGKDRRIS